jgi:hypothetical protein
MIVLLGIVLSQALLYGPALAGRKVLLPLDMLAAPMVYLPLTPGAVGSRSQNELLSDLIFLAEPGRRFAVSELRAGRLPAWTPYRFAGAPVVLARFSPFVLLQCCTESPVILAWAQLFAALVAGFGLYVFCRRVLGLGFWPAAVASWCYPLTGFFILWQGYSTSLPVCWLPWLLLAVEGEVQGPKSKVQSRKSAPIGLSLVTCLVLISGQLDVAGQVLLVSGLYALWRLLDCGLRIADCGIRNGPASSSIPKCEIRNPKSEIRTAVLKLAAGWGLGILLASPYVLPLLEYSHTGARLARRAGGTEERPPAGWSALPKVVLPELHGGMSGGSLGWGGEVQAESSAAGYAGATAMLVLAPLAWRSRRHRSFNVFWALLALVGLSWCLNVPGLVQILRLPGLNMMSHNRLVFADAFAFTAFMATGLEVLLQNQARRRWWFWLPTAVLAALCTWSLCWARSLPEPLATQLQREIVAGKISSWVHDLEGVQRVHSWFWLHYSVAACWCGLGVALWLVIWVRPAWQRWLLPALAPILLGELLWYGHSRIVQQDPALYFPPVRVLEQAAQAAPGRIIGALCLPANLGEACGLRDVRGYDAVEPKEYLELLNLARDAQSPAYSYATSQWMAPSATLTDEGVLEFSPILGMLGVHYVITRQAPPPRTPPAFAEADYWVLTNTTALPRAYVPRRIEVAADARTRLEKLGSPTFAPREVAYLESAVELPAACRGSVEVLAEIPARLTLALHLETPGLVVLADRWDKGWRAYLNGQRVPILKANHALRGVVAPAGEGKLEFRYEPASFAWGLRLAGLGAIGLAAWGGVQSSKLRGRQSWIN